ncbi:MAG: hypothetical protein BWY15_01675 [Firmicutes bacterium ADurb.Bin193]|nr:MAG: hypothetical protein BWY15_01675 [Firmicutes bacterium ADurb.Bin193]
MELEKANKIINDLELLINGIDPSTNHKFEVDTILNNKYNNLLLREVHKMLSEYMKVCDINHAFDKRRKQFFHIDDLRKKEIPISEDAIPISTFAYTLNDFIDTTTMKKVKASEITKWLMIEGYLEETEHDDGKVFKILTAKASEIGMIKKTKKNSYGRTYDVNLYSAKAQKFIVDNLDTISHFIKTHFTNA